LWSVSVLIKRQAIIFPNGEIRHVDFTIVFAQGVDREVLDAQVDLAHHVVAVHEVEPSFDGLAGDLGPVI